jgi:F-type H+-transporting ATPase subunit beta
VRGANPNVRAFRGLTPLHVARLRGFQEIADLLLEHGADEDALDPSGRTASDWQPPERRSDALPPMASPIPTGLRALDLFAPIVPGDLVHANFAPGLGAVVLAGELTHRFHRLTRGDVPAVIWAGWGLRPVDRAEVDHAFDELQLRAGARLVWGELGESASGGVVERAFGAARGLQQAGARDVLLVVFSHGARSAEIEAALPCTGSGDCGSITCLVMDRDGETVPDHGELPAPWDARMTFDPRRAKARLFPAIDVVSSVSKGASSRVGAVQLGLVERARRVLSEEPGSERAKRLDEFLCQGFFVAEPFSGHPGEWPSLAEQVAGLAQVLDA